MISVLLATTGRPERARASLESLYATTEDHDVEVVAAVDADPKTCRAIESFVQTLIYSPTLRGCSNAWNDCLREARGDPVCLAADDLVFQEGWLDAALEALSAFEDGWGLVGFNDGRTDGHDYATHYLASRKLIVEAFGGVIAWPHYQHSFNDVEATQRAKAINRYAWAEDSHVHHEHWLFGDRRKDETDRRNLDRHPESQELYGRRAAAGFPNDVPPVLAE